MLQGMTQTELLLQIERKWKDGIDTSHFWQNPASEWERAKGTRNSNWGNLAAQRDHRRSSAENPDHGRDSVLNGDGKPGASRWFGADWKKRNGPWRGPRGRNANLNRRREI